MKTYSTVAGVVRFKDKFLLLKRTPNRRHSPYKWQTISGHIREKESAEEAVLREVKEETSLSGKILKSGKSFEVSDEWGRWIIIPFLIEVDSDEVKIDSEEHSEYKWIETRELKDFNCVKNIEKNFEVFGIKI